MLRSRPLLLMAFVLAILSTAAFGQKKLSVGDSAPGLDIEAWVKGEETTIEPDRIYVVEFWATWCGPCKRSIPHLSELQREYADRDLTIIGISDEERSTVEPWVKNQGSRMDYTVAVDRAKSTNRAWMQAAGLNGIPAAFIIDRKGVIQWIGNPLDSEFDLVLKQVVGGRYDAKLSAAAQSPLNAARTARKVKNWRLAHKHYDDVIAADSHVFAPLTIEKFEMLLVDQLDSESAYSYATEVMGTYRDDATLLADFARFIAASPTLTKDQRDFKVALEFATAARQAKGGEGPQAYSTLAAVYYHKGDIENAVKNQQRAWMMADQKRKPEYLRVLDTYRSAQARAQIKG